MLTSSMAMPTHAPTNASAMITIRNTRAVAGPICRNAITIPCTPSTEPAIAEAETTPMKLPRSMTPMTAPSNTPYTQFTSPVRIETTHSCTNPLGSRPIIWPRRSTRQPATKPS